MDKCSESLEKLTALRGQLSEVAHSLTTTDCETLRASVSSMVDVTNEIAMTSERVEKDCKLTPKVLPDTIAFG